MAPAVKMLHVQLRDYREADWPAICRIHDLARVIEIGSVVPKAEILPMSVAAGGEGFFDSRTWVACNGVGIVVGFISARPPELTWCYVDPAWHRRGVGRQMVGHVLPALGDDAFVLTAAESPGALPFYLSMRFVVAARFPGEEQGYPCECVRLTLPDSTHRRRPPSPSAAALRLAGFTEASLGNAYLDDDGVYYWR